MSEAHEKYADTPIFPRSGGGGLTRYEWFLGLAIQGLLAAGEGCGLDTPDDYEELAEEAGRIANAAVKHAYGVIP